uniref:hotdog domain-containing protein n=1 Tax=Sphingomonas sp. TaxID=28214 RepID=UPI0035BC1C95
FLSPARAGETLIAEAREIALAGRSGVYAVEIRAVDGRPVANFQGLSRAVGGSILSGDKP